MITTESRMFNFLANLVPLGTLDIESAIETSIKIGHSEEWLAEKVRDFKDACDVPLEDIDVVAVVYDVIYHDALNEIEELTGANFESDFKNNCTLAANYLCTTFDCSGEFVEEMEALLSEHGIEKESLTLATQYFLDEIGV
jgi:hypothetical protein